MASSGSEGSGSGGGPPSGPTHIVEKAGQKAAGRPAALDDVETFIAARPDEREVAVVVVAAGPGQGQRRYVRTGTNSIGRDAGNRIVLDFGDGAISRSGHAVIVHDGKSGELEIVDGGKPNGVLLNGAAVQGSARLAIGDMLTIGRTSLKLEAI